MPLSQHVRICSTFDLDRCRGFCHRTGSDLFLFSPDSWPPDLNIWIIIYLTILYLLNMKLFGLHVLDFIRCTRNGKPIDM